MNHEKRQKVAYAGLVFLTTVIALYVGQAFIPVMLWAGILAIAVEPLRKRLNSKMPGKNALVATILTTGIVALVIIPLILAVYQGAVEASNLAVWWSKLQAEGMQAPQWLQNIPFGSKQAVTWWNEHLTTGELARAQITQLIPEDFLESSKSLGHGIIERLIIFGFTVMTLFFFVKDHDAIVAHIEKGSGLAFGEKGSKLLHQVASSIRGTIDGMVLLGLAQGMLMAIVFAIAGVPHPILMGLASGIGAMVPFGLLVVLTLAVLILVVKGATTAAIIVGIVGGVTNFVIDHGPRPALIGNATQLPFLLVFIGVIGGVETIGILGLFVGPAVMAAMMMMWREWSQEGMENE